jgi:hypothetical protein
VDDIYARFDYGYDPDTVEDCPIATIPLWMETLPPRATVNPAWLPPVGRQTTPSCFVWSTIYGLATYKGARAGNYTPSEPSLQASPYYAYIKILEQHKVLLDACTGGSISWCFELLEADDGTPNLEQAPEPAPGGSPCHAAWSSYGSSVMVSDYAFRVAGGRQFGIKDAVGLQRLRSMIAGDRPLAYGTRLYTDFPDYGQSSPAPVPYVGNGTLLMRDEMPVGHCMMIIGYDDALGAVLIQNSFGTDWGTEWNGSRGYVWMAYETFQTLAQGSAFFITED